MTDRPVVMDASVALALSLGEPQARAIHGALGRWMSTTRPIVVPEHFWLEVLNRLARRGRTGAQILEELYELDILGIRTVSVDRPLLLLASDLMERHGLTAYDAAYLALCHSLSATLATLDLDLRRAAGDLAEGGLGADGSPHGHRISAPSTAYEAERPVTWPRWSGAGSYLGSLRRRAMADIG